MAKKTVTLKGRFLGGNALEIWAYLNNESLSNRERLSHSLFSTSVSLLDFSPVVSVLVLICISFCTTDLKKLLKNGNKVWVPLNVKISRRRSTRQYFVLLSFINDLKQLVTHLGKVNPVIKN